MRRTLQAFGTVAMVLASAAIGFVAGVVLMARQEAPTPVAPEPAPPPRWERSI